MWPVSMVTALNLRGSHGMAYSIKEVAMALLNQSSRW